MYALPLLAGVLTSVAVRTPWVQPSANFQSKPFLSLVFDNQECLTWTCSRKSPSSRRKNIVALSAAALRAFFIRCSSSRSTLTGPTLLPDRYSKCSVGNEGLYRKYDPTTNCPLDGIGRRSQLSIVRQLYHDAVCCLQEPTHPVSKFHYWIPTAC